MRQGCQVGKVASPLSDIWLRILKKCQTGNPVLLRLSYLHVDVPEGEVPGLVFPPDEVDHHVGVLHGASVCVCVLRSCKF